MDARSRLDRRTTIPRQRRTTRGVAAVVGVGEDPGEAVSYAAREASYRGVPLELVLPLVAEDDKARCLARMDEALAVARRAFPRLEVRVHLGAADLSSWLRRSDHPVDLVVLGKGEAAVVARMSGEAAEGERALLAGCQVVVV